MKIFATHLAGALPLALNGNSPQQPMRGTPFVDIGLQPTGSATYPLDVVAALSADRKTFLLSVVNPTEQSHKFTHQISGVKLRGSGKLWQIAPPDVNAANEPGKEPVVKIAEILQGRLADEIDLPPISISIYEFSVEQV